MSINDVLKAAPYYTDHDPTKNRMMVLFRPGPAIQTRELNELQSILQSQLSSHASHIFANGSKVLGGEITRKTVTFYRLESTYNAVPVDLTDWLGKKVYATDSNGSNLGLTATVIAYANATDTDAPTIYVENDGQAAISVFPAGTTVRVEGSGLTAKVIADAATYTGRTLYVGVSAGTYYIDKHFVTVESQSILAAKYKAAPSGHVGFVYDTDIVTSDVDSDLRDPAAGRNRGAPGADRVVMNANLAFFEIEQDRPDNFVPIIEIEDGLVKTENKVPIYSEIAEEIARRTYDESGNYTVRPFTLRAREHVGTKIVSITSSGAALAHIATAKCATAHALVVGAEIKIAGVTGPNAGVYNGDFIVESLPDTYTFTYAMRSVPTAAAEGAEIRVTRPDYFTAEMSPGKGYVLGFEHEKIAPSYVDVPKARTTGVIQNYSATAFYGNYVTGSLVGLINDTIGQIADLQNASNTKIGEARVRYVRWHSGAPGSGSARYRVYLYDIKVTSGAFADVRRVVAPGGNLVLDLVDGRAQLLGSNEVGLIVRAPERAVKTLRPGGTSDISFQTHFYAEQATTGSNQVVFNVTGDRYWIGPAGGSNFAGSSTANENYIFTAAGTGAVLAPTWISIDASGKNLTVQFAAAATVQMQATIQESNRPHKTKTLTEETIAINLTDSSLWWSLNVADVHSIVKVTGPSGNDITSGFLLDDGQRDDFYDHARVKSKTIGIPGGTYQVRVKRWDHSGEGYFSVDSYAGYKAHEIPVYTSPSTGARVNLADALDFRPVRQRNTTLAAGYKIPRPDTLITSDYEFYLPRRDRLVLDKKGIFKTIRGMPSLVPYLPPEPDDAMTLYELYIHPYTADASKDVDAKFIENKRYTMRDVGRIEKRVDRIEYYTELSLLEMSVKGQDVVDANGLDRFKNGFLVDAFTGHKVGDVRSADYRCSIDPSARELRPAFFSDRIRVNYSADSNSVKQVGNDETGVFLTLPFTETVHMRNLGASKAVSVNPYLVVDFRGSLVTNPPSDDWMDTSVAPAVNVDLTGDADAWQFMAGAINTGMAPGYGTQWNDWQTTWSGVTATSKSSTSSASISRDVQNGQTGTTITNTTSTTTKKTITTKQSRTGEQTQVGFGVETASLGEKVIDVSLAYWMRAASIRLIASGLRPNTNLHAFVDDVKVNASITPDAGYAPTTEGALRTDANGIVKGTLSIPAGKFRTGERVIKLIDEPNDVEANASTWASYVFSSSGLHLTRQDSIVSTRVPVLSTAAISESRSKSVVKSSTQQKASSIFTPDPPPPPAPERMQEPGDGDPERDPLAQTFFVNEEIHPYGVFISSVDLYFKNRPGNDGHPVWLELRPVINGYPHATKTVPMSHLTKVPSDVNLPQRTDDIESIRQAPTKFSFPVPIYLEPGEHSVVVGSNSPEYECYVSELGEKLYGTNAIIGAQATLGSLFKSQNAGTWTPSQFEDLMLQINRAEFDTSAVGVAVTRNTNDGKYRRANLAMYTANILSFDPVANVKHELKIFDVATNSMPAEWTLIQRDVNVEFPTEKACLTDGSLLVQTTLSTTRSDVAPLFDLSNNSVTLVHNQINNDSTGENSNSGGNALARYLTRRVTLAEDFDTDYLKVTIDMYRPNGTTVKVYAKAIAADDPTPFEMRPWTEMVMDTSKPIYSQAADHFIETNFVPASGTLQYTSGGVTYKTAKTYAVKIVMLSNNTSVVPRIRDLRAISTLPA